MKKDRETAFLTGIKKVGFSSAEIVVILHHEKLAPGVSVQVIGEFEEICIEGLASVETKMQKQHGVDIYDTKLKFRADDNINSVFPLTSILTGFRAIYRLTTVTDEQYLLGTTNKPLPQVKSTAVNPASPSGARITEYEVSYVNTFGLLPIVNSDDTVRGLSMDKMILE